MKRPLVGGITLAVLLTGGASLPSKLAAQLPLPSASALSLGDQVTATARGVEAISRNPASLALGDGGFSFSLLPARFESGLDPVSLGDLADFNGRAVPRSVRERWLERIATEGGERGFAQAEITGAAASWGHFGVQLSAVAIGKVHLNRDAGELILFGNAGLTGSPQTFDFGGSTVDAFLISTLAFGYGREIGRIGGGRLALGATTKIVVGNGLLVARDQGTFADPDPIEVRVDLPVLSNPSSGGGVEHGTGLGFDVGASWERDRWKLGATVRNVLNTFGWFLDDLVFRPGTGLIDEEEDDTDFDERPSEQAPQELREEVLALGFGPELALGAGLQLSEDLDLSSEIWLRRDDGMAVGPDFRIGAGAEYRPRSFLNLRAHLSLLDAGIAFGGGAGLSVGRLHLDGGLGTRVLGSASSTYLMLGLTFAGGR